MTVHNTLLTVVLFLVIIPTHALETIRIGAPLPITGALAPEALKQQRGYELWASVANSAGGIRIKGKQYNVEIVYSDYQSNSKKARKAAENLIKKKKVKFLFAPYGSKAAREASPIAQKYNIPMIAVTASSYQAYNRGHKYIFGTLTPNATLIDPIMKLIANNFKHIKKLAILVRNDLFPISIAREIVASSKLNGLNIIFHELYDINATDHNAALSKMKLEKPDWIFAVGYTKDLVLVRKTMAELDLNANVITMIAAPAYQEFIDDTGILSENITSAAWWHPAVNYKGNDVFGSTKNFVELFQKRYGTLPDYVEASAAVAGALFQMSIERAGTIDGKSVRDQLANINETTFWGPIKFGANGQNESLEPLIFQIQDGKPVIIYPYEMASGELKLFTQ